MHDITQILVTLCSMCTAIMCIYIIPKLKESFEPDKFQEALELTEQINKYINIFVLAAEQIYKPEEGEEKFEYVEGLVSRKLDSLGITYNRQEVAAQIEACVKQVHEALRK